MSAPNKRAVVIRIVSWNMSHWQQTPAQRAAAWDYLGSLHPDFALLQEAVPRDDLAPTHCVYRPGGIGNRRPWGSAVISFAGPITEVVELPASPSAQPVPLQHTYPGSVAVALCEPGLTLISAYGLIENGYAVATVHKQLSDLTPLFDSKFGRRVVLAGDLNVSTQLKEPDRSRHRNARERFGTLGLTECLGLERPSRERLADCPCEDDPCRHVRTQRHGNSDVPWQNDYFFVSRSLVATVQACFAADGGQADSWDLSGHCPVILEVGAV